MLIILLNIILFVFGFIALSEEFDNLWRLMITIVPLLTLIFIFIYDNDFLRQNIAEWKKEENIFYLWFKVKKKKLKKELDD